MVKFKKFTTETKDKFISRYTQEICNNFSTNYLQKPETKLNFAHSLCKHDAYWRLQCNLKTFTKWSPPSTSESTYFF